MELTFEWQMKKIEERIDNKRREVNDRQYELELLEKERVNIANSRRRHLVWGYVETANQWLNKRDTVDKRLKCPEKTAYNHLNMIIHDVIDRPVKEITEICYGGYEEYYVRVAFKLFDDPVEYAIQFPNYGNLTIKHMSDANYAMYTLYNVERKKENWSHFALLWSGYDLENIKAYFKEDKDGDPNN